MVGESEMKSAIILSVVAGLMLASCTSAGDDLPAIATYAPGNSSNDVLLHGTLVVHDDCIMVRSDSSPAAFMMPVWPEGFSVAAEDETLSVLDGSGRTRGTVGRPIRLGGGPAGLSMITSGDTPERCLRKNRMFAVAPPRN
jgi:hypothetical protein